jgi:predicted DsbA family dithiol-disulfide isomerase
MVGAGAAKVKQRFSSGDASMNLDVFSDTICPWCFIGKRRLERALKARPQPGLKVRWRAFQLNPGMPAEGMERRAYIEAKFGGTERARTIYDTVRAAGAGEGIEFAFEKIKRTPNTLQSHRLLRLAAATGDQDAVLEGLFRAYFLEGRDVGDRAVLTEIGAAAGLDRRKTAGFLGSDTDTDTVLSEDVLARRAGINGVPCFIFNGRFALSGAQEPEAFFQIFDLTREQENMLQEAAGAS